MRFDEDLEFARLSRLVATASVSPMTDADIDRCAEILAPLGCRRVGSELIGRGDPSAARWFYTHVDTKPPTPLGGWDTDPFTLVSAGDRWTGLGASDSKAQLINALLVAEDDDFVLVDTSEECDGDGAAARLLTEHDPDLVIVCDGAAPEGIDYYVGQRGQLDGRIHLDTGKEPLHPARADGDAGRLIEGLLAELRELPVPVVLTGISAPQHERSLSMQQVELRFDMRFTPSQEALVLSFVDRWKVDVCQFMLPLMGSSCPSLPGLSDGGIAPFSTRLSMPGRPVRPRGLVVVPGADPDNHNHKPNEFVRPQRMAAHRQVLHSVATMSKEQR